MKPYLKSEENINQPASFSGPYSIFDYIITNSPSYSLTNLGKAYSYFYLYKFKPKDFSGSRYALDKEYDYLSEEIKVNPSIDIALQYGICSFINSSYNNDNTMLDEVRKHFRKNNYYLGIKGHSSYILTEEVGFVLGLLTLSKKDEIYNKVMENTNKDGDDEIIFRLNYYLALKIRDKDIDEKDARDKAENLIIRESVYHIEKIVALPFCDSPGTYYDKIVDSFITPEFYVNLFGGVSVDMEVNSYIKMQPVKIINFLMVSNLLGWNKLEQVKPELIKNMEKLKVYKDPIIFEKSQYKKKIVEKMIMSLFIGAFVVIFIFSLIMHFTIVLSIFTGGVSIILSVLDLFRLNLKNTLKVEEENKK
jgi:hypothetical protein